VHNTLEYPESLFEGFLLDRVLRASVARQGLALDSAPRRDGFWLAADPIGETIAWETPKYYRYYFLALRAFLLATTWATNGDRFWAKALRSRLKSSTEPFSSELPKANTRVEICRSLTPIDPRVGGDGRHRGSRARYRRS